MKAKLCLIALVVAAAGVVAGGCGYVASLASRTRSLEARLARVEATLNAKEAAAAWRPMPPAGLAGNSAQPLLRLPQTSPPAGEMGSLERRVEKIEQELKPHLEFLSPARPDAPGLTR
jgi:hypothetical protein